MRAQPLLSLDTYSFSLSLNYLRLPSYGSNNLTLLVVLSIPIDFYTQYYKWCILYLFE